MIRGSALHIWENSLESEQVRAVPSAQTEKRAACGSFSLHQGKTDRRGRRSLQDCAESVQTVGRGLAPAAFVRILTLPPLCKGRCRRSRRRDCYRAMAQPLSHLTSGCFSFSLAKSSAEHRRRKTPRDATRLGQLTPYTGEPGDAHVAPPFSLQYLVNLLHFASVS